MSKSVTVAIPTFSRITSLAVTLSSLISQSFQDFDVVISEQNRNSVIDDSSIQTVTRILSLRHQITLMYTYPKGMAHQRQMLLETCRSPYILYLDDDLVLEPTVINELVKTLSKAKLGFVGMAPIGLSFIHDIRPEQQHIEFWHDKVIPETITENSSQWQRYKLHNAANMYHVAKQLKISSPRLYKIAWVGGCVLYDRQKLIEAGGFNFWKQIPTEHTGEDVLAELHVMAKYGGCGIIPSGVYHQELPTTISNRDIDAPKVLK